MAYKNVTYRIFNGERYKFDGFMRNLASAKAHAKQRRSMGYKARIAKAGGAYLKSNPGARSVYIRKK